MLLWLQCGVARFPQGSLTLIMHANFIIEVNKDGQSGRGILQSAAKCNPSFIERYFIYCCQEVVKHLKTEGESMDLMGYVEFQRNYR